MNRIKSLDGLRAISITMVIFGHLSRYLPSSILENPAYIIVSNSALGVSIFFVISGYLITKLLIIEKEKKGDNNLKHFYTRRILRIFPIFYLYILVLVVIKTFFIPNIINNYTEIIFAALYLWNYKHLFVKVPHANANFYLGHYWSLSMEEQFYLIWPMMFVKVRREKLIMVIIVLIVLMPFIRVATYFLMPDSRGQLHMMIQTGGDSILIGCLGALLENKESFRNKYFRYLRNPFLVTFAIVYIFIVSRTLEYYYGGKYSMSIGESLDNIFILIFLLWCIYVPTKFSVFLNSKLMTQVGIISYSIYIWHVLVLRNPGHLLPDSLIIKIIVILIVGFASYYLIEKPILRLKSRFKDI